MDNTEQQIAEFLFPFPKEIEALAQQLRDYLRKETKPKIELVGDSTISVNIGYGFTKKAWDCYCAIIVYSKHINISFPSGASLPDPLGLLKGTGSRIRHIRISVLKDVKNPAVTKILMEARNKAYALIDEAPANPNKCETIIKKISGIKKRPK